MLSNKVVVFDLDETLGYFLELGKFWELLHKYFSLNIFNSVNIVKLTQQDFNDMFDLFPEFIRPNIYSLLNYLKYKKIKGLCNNVMLYTNNQGPRYWANLIIEYFHEKIHYHLFDQIIAAFKVNGKRMEMCRTTHEKTAQDFIHCTKLPKNIQICFLDDVFYPEMTGDNIYYIKINPYVHNISFDVMIKRFVSSDLGKRLLNNDKKREEEFINYSNDFLKGFTYTYSEKSREEYEIDKIVTKKTMLLLQDFFKKSWKEKTRKNNRKNNKQKTMKRNY